MSDRPLANRRILVVEDEYLLADEVAQELESRGAVVLGPVPDVEMALALLDEQTPLDGAVLDVNLSGRPVFPVVDTLIERGIPVIFTTGYDAGTFPDRFAHIPRCEKPIDMKQITFALCKALQT